MPAALTQTLLWWLIAQGVGLTALPITAAIFRHLDDRGIAFSKIMGLLIWAYLFWMGASVGILPNTLSGMWIAWAGLLTISLLVIFFARKRIPWRQWRQVWQAQRSAFLITELLFTLALIGWVVVRAYAPGKIIFAYGEQYMELAFLNGILRSPGFPPLDPWLAGYSISYYYFGYVMMALFTRVSGASPTAAFELYDALIFALTAAGVFGLLRNLIRAGKGSKLAASLTGILGIIFLQGMGNLEGIFHLLQSAGELPMKILRWLDIPLLTAAPQIGSLYPGYDFRQWWWWAASRVVADKNLAGAPLGSGNITEFPFFSFLLGDNHPHKFALPFVILCIGFAFTLLIRPAGLKGRDWVFFYGFYTLALGALGFLNTWDMPISGLLAVIVFFIRQRGQSHPWRKTFGFGISFGAVSLLLYTLFYTHFSSQAGGVLPYVFTPTRLPQYAVMFAPFLLILAAFLTLLAQRHTHWRSTAVAWLGIVFLSYAPYLLISAAAWTAITNGWLPNLPGGWSDPLKLQILLGLSAPTQTTILSAAQVLERILLARLQDPFTFLLLSGLIAPGIAAAWRMQKEAASSDFDSPTLFGLIIATLGLTMTLGIEFYYLQDNFGLRMNSVFKFYFQGWVWMSIASAYACWWMWNHRWRSGWIKKLFFVIVIMLVAACLSYSLTALYSRVHGFAFPPHLDGAATLAGDYPTHWAASSDDWAAIRWLQTNVTGAPVILEAPGEDYQLNGRISAFTGLPTLIGWVGHESQWRGAGVNNEINARVADAALIYITPDAQVALDALHRRQVRYLTLGKVEREFIRQTCQKTSCDPLQAERKFDSILQLRFQQGETSLYAVP